MRIIAGKMRGRRLAAPGRRFDRLIRPTSDRAREAIFSILGELVESAHVLDLYAGTGAMGLEALSRGAAAAMFVDGSRDVAALIAANISACRVEGQATVVQRDLSRGLGFLATRHSGQPFDLVFVDPPYGKGLGLKALAELTAGVIVAPGGVIVVEDQAASQYPAEAGAWHCYDQRRYGEAGFWLFRHE